MVNKKAQLKIQQMAFMLIAVTLFFILVGLFVLGIKLSGLKKQANILEDESSLAILSKLANSPEFSCGEAFYSGKTNCVDEAKILALKNKKEYFEENFWGVAAIEIKKIYPEKKSIVIYEDNSQSKKYNSNFVNLCKKQVDSDGNVYDKCEIAELLVASKENEI